ncbi:hypothetical protein [Pontibacter ramchanderi]|uniref:hypothetical protein n=1 Tax=Pontibacter ramchanderi TaxID=1179743 RepID=UPI000C705D59|nr:hypothetical protein [Pontibacter ramchanderi]
MFNGFPDAVFFIIADLLIVIFHVLLLFGWRTKYTSLALFFVLLICQSFSFSFGKIDHNIIWLVIPLVMAFSGWGNTYSIDSLYQRKEDVNPWAISLMALLLGFAMFTASFPKIYSGWLSFDSHATFPHMVYNDLYWDREPLLLQEVLQIKNIVFWEALDYLAVVFEFGFLLAIFWPQVFRFFVFSAVLFHISIFLTFGIVFTNNLLTYLLFINWAIFYPVLNSASFNNIANKFIRPKYLFVCLTLILSYGLYHFFFREGFMVPSLLEFIHNTFSINIDQRLLKTLILFSISLIIAFTSLVLYIYTQIHERRQVMISSGRPFKKEVV